jgi:phosphoribosyl-ATP pyrophosphohydrolase/phosphoribosyl-AMP cyclohydrolase
MIKSVIEMTKKYTDWLDSLNFKKLDGLIPVVVQHKDTNEVLMVGFTNREALELTLNTGFLHFFSRTKQRLWKKGETSGNTLKTHFLLTDCDKDALVAKVIPSGPVCHTGNSGCFFNSPILL